MQVRYPLCYPTLSPPSPLSTLDCCETLITQGASVMIHDDMSKKTPIHCAGKIPSMLPPSIPPSPLSTLDCCETLITQEPASWYMMTYLRKHHTLVQVRYPLCYPLYSPPPPPLSTLDCCETLITQGASVMIHMTYLKKTPYTVQVRYPLCYPPLSPPLSLPLTAVRHS